MKKVLLMLLATAMILSVFAGCGQKDVEEVVDDVVDDVVEDTTEDTTAEATEGTEEVVEEDEPVVMNWNLGAEPKTIDPGLNGASDGFHVIMNTFETLVNERSGVVTPGIAETWDVSDDGLTVTFHLRESNWSDGTPLTANDFVYGWTRAMAPETASEYSWLWHYTNIAGAEDYVDTGLIPGYQDTIDKGVGALKDEEDPESTITEEDVTKATEMIAELSQYSAETVGIKAVDDYTFEVQLMAPTGYFVSLMAFGLFAPVNQASVEAGPEGTWATDPALAVSNGPFVVTDYVIGDGMVLEKNENYWEVENVGIDIINTKFIDDENTAYNAYLNGDLDLLLSVPPAEVPRLKAEDPNFYIFPSLATYYMTFNLKKDFWDDARVRRAISMAIDREAICEVLAAGQIPAAGFVPPGFKDHNGDDFFETAGMYGFATDDSAVEAAQALLAEAGYPGGEGFPEFVILINNNVGHQTVAEMIQEQLKVNLGLTANVKAQEWAVFQDTLHSGNFEMSRTGWGADFMDPIGMLAIFKSDNFYNDPGYNSPEFDDALTRASEATTPAAHFEALYEAQEIFVMDSPVVPVYHYTKSYLVRENIYGWDRSVLDAIDFSNAYME